LDGIARSDVAALRRLVVPVLLPALERRFILLP
jgi:hypothetical protein